VDGTDVTRMGSLRGLKHKEITEDIFNAFHRIAKDTGGVVDSSANISAAFKKAAYVIRKLLSIILFSDRLYSRWKIQKY